MTHKLSIAVLTTFVASGLLLTAFSSVESPLTRTYGGAQALGNGTIRTWIDTRQDGKPVAAGIELSKKALTGLPAKRNNFSRCYDIDGDGQLGAMECEGDVDLKLEMPQIAGSLLQPYVWAGVNFNPEGHAPENWVVPHFDFHFYTVSMEAVEAIRTGPCNIIINCDDLKKAVLPVEAKYVASDYININAAVSEMGNHLVDSTSPQMGPPFAKAENVFIYGAYGGHITFLEPMITLEKILDTTNACYPIKTPEAWEMAGYYPSKYCLKQDDNGYHISLEGLSYYDKG